MEDRRHLTDWQCIAILLALAAAACLLYLLLVPSPEVIRPQQEETTREAQ